MKNSECSSGQRCGFTGGCLTVAEQTALQKLIRRAEPLAGTYFRSVERRFMDPTEILNGRGTELYGGRFAPIGMKAVYLARCTGVDRFWLTC